MEREGFTKKLATVSWSSHSARNPAPSSQYWKVVLGWMQMNVMQQQDAIQILLGFLKKDF